MTERIGRTLVLQRFIPQLLALVVIETARIRRTACGDRSPSALLALLIAISLAADFLMVLALTMIPALPIVFFPLSQATVGCTLAQGCLLAAWLAWSDQPFWQRLLRHWIVAAILYLVWVAGLALGQPDQSGHLSLTVGLSVPLISIAAQLPLWIARYMFGWRLIRGEENGDARLPRLSIRGLMTATVIVALALAMARLAPSPDGKPIGMLWVIMFAVATGISTISLLPVSPLLMRTPQFSHGVLFSSLYAAFWIALPWLIMLVAWGRGLFPPLTAPRTYRNLVLRPLLRDHRDLGRRGRPRPRLQADFGPATAPRWRFLTRQPCLAAG